MSPQQCLEPWLQSGRSFVELSEFNQDPYMGISAGKRAGGALSLSGGLFALSCFRSATQFPLEPLTP
jgi:hypothetical protein